MRLRHRSRPHSGPARHLNPPYGAKRRHGGRLHVRAEGGETKPRADRPRRRQAGGSLSNSNMTPSQQAAMNMAANSAGQNMQGYNPINPASQAALSQEISQQAMGPGSGNKRGGRVRIRRPGGQSARHHADGGSANGHWMQKAFANAHGQFKAKAARAGKSTQAFAKSVTKPGSHASTKTKRQANLAKLGAKYGGH